MRRLMDKHFSKRSSSPSSSQAPPPSYESEKLASNNPYKTYAPPAEPPPNTVPAYNAGPSKAGPAAPDYLYHSNESAGPSAGQVNQGQGNGDAPPPYDPWLAVPDTTLLPPPPPMREDFSPANNATPDEAALARTWCYNNPIWGPRTWSGPEMSQIQHRQFTLATPPDTPYTKISHLGPQKTLLQCYRKQEDVTILSNLPLFTGQYPLQPNEQRTIYFEVNIKQLSGPTAIVAIGFLAPPYPPSRLPGWQRGSLGVHSDDGRRYISDDGGGVEFVPTFGSGDRVGIGMSFKGTPYQGQPPTTQVFFTRNGVAENSWDLHESVDVEDGGVMGLDGTTDIYAAIGVSDNVQLEVSWAGFD